MGVVDQPVEDAIGGGGIADLFVPTCHRQLGSEDGRAGLVAILQNNAGQIVPIEPQGRTISRAAAAHTTPFR